SPLLLAFSMLLTLGLVAFWFGVYAAPIKGIILNLGEGLSSRSGVVALFAVLAIVGVAGAGLGAWLALGWVRKAYLAKLISDRSPDRDGWYRINNFFCRADAWQAVLAQLVREGDVVLMDLRSFSAGNAGCEHELHYLIEFVPLARCILIVDRTTDIDYLHSTI